MPRPTRKIDIIHRCVTAGEAGPHVLILAGIHGDEFEPMLAAMNLQTLLKNKLRRGNVTIVAVANQGAYLNGTRCASDGKDLARVMPGRGDSASLTKRTASRLSDLILRADYLIDLHTGGTLYDIMPLAGYMLHQDKSVLDMQRKMAAAFGLPTIWGTAPEKGRTLSVAWKHGIPAIYAECHGGLAVNPRTIKRYERGCMNVLRMLGMIRSARVTPSNNRLWLEDHSPGQGHLQSKLPSPQAGIFVPSINLGEKIVKGQTIGRIIDPLQQVNCSVTVQESGVVFMLRRSSKVNVGDTLGGILPVTSVKKKINIRYAG